MAQPIGKRQVRQGEAKLLRAQAKNSYNDSVRKQAIENLNNAASNSMSKMFANNKESDEVTQMADATYQGRRTPMQSVFKKPQQ
jgi:hypothetical protein